MRKLDAEIQFIEEVVDFVMNNRRCPKCHQLALQLVTSSGNPTGIFECVNAQCSIRTFDPNMPEVIQ